MRVLALLAATAALAGCAATERGHTTMRTLPREINRVSSQAQLKAGRNACRNLPAGIARGKQALRIYLKKEFPTYDTAVMLRGCEQALGR